MCLAPQYIAVNSARKTSNRGWEPFGFQGFRVFDKMKANERKPFPWKYNGGVDMFGVPYDRVVRVPCGKCCECNLTTATEWGLRVELESRLYDPESLCMVTLTYSDNYLPDDGLNRRDVQLFFKRLRRKFNDRKIRYFGCGEYGTKNTRRAHYHVILFGYKPQDLVFYRMSSRQHPVYLSAELERVWHMGHVYVSDFDPDEGKYSALYFSKFVDRPDKNPCFRFMSLKPSIGFGSFDPERDFRNGCLYVRGKQKSIPRSFIKSFERSFEKNSPTANSVYYDFRHRNARRWFRSGLGRFHVPEMVNEDGEIMSYTINDGLVDYKNQEKESIAVRRERWRTIFGRDPFAPSRRYRKKKDNEEVIKYDRNSKTYIVRKSRYSSEFEKINI